MAPKFIMLCNKNEFKSLSLEDNLYFTLRDLFLNAKCFDNFITANKFSSELTGGVCFEDRTLDFQYSNALQDKNYVYDLIEWLSYINDASCFKEVDEEGNEPFQLIAFDEWFHQFMNLKNLLKERYEQICMKMEDI